MATLWYKACGSVRQNASTNVSRLVVCVYTRRDKTQKRQRHVIYFFFLFFFFEGFADAVTACCRAFSAAT
eukprot:m.20585 g.20585  ORF g.20585 m.20585 type:complete len:70 (-) comp3807_c0_seq1:523-732(-)